jgi:hypothetical protein
MINRLRVFSLTLTEILLPSSPGHQFIHNEVKRMPNMIYVHLRRVNLPATVTNKSSYVANGLVDDLTTNMKEEKFSS